MFLHGVGEQGEGQLKLMAFEQNELWLCANERIPWHENLGGEEAIQNRVHELVIFNRSELKCYLKNRFEPNIHSFFFLLKGKLTYFL